MKDSLQNVPWSYLQIKRINNNLSITAQTATKNQRPLTYRDKEGIFVLNFKENPTDGKQTDVFDAIGIVDINQIPTTKVYSKTDPESETGPWVYLKFRKINDQLLMISASDIKRKDSSLETEKSICKIRMNGSKTYINLRDIPIISENDTIGLKA